jgi:hypothetical protein
MKSNGNIMKEIVHVVYGSSQKAELSDLQLELRERLIAPCFGEFNVVNLRELFIFQPDPKCWGILEFAHS